MRFSAAYFCRKRLTFIVLAKFFFVGIFPRLVKSLIKKGLHSSFCYFSLIFTEQGTKDSLPKGTIFGTSSFLLLYRNLYQREPLLGIVLVPCTVDVACARMSCHLVALLLHVGEGLGKRLVEALVGSHVLHA